MQKNTSRSVILFEAFSSSGSMQENEWTSGESPGVSPSRGIGTGQALPLLLSCYYGTFIYYWEFTLGRDPPGEVLHTATDRKGSGLLRLVGGWDAILSPIRLLPEPSRWGRPSSELPANYSSHVLGHWCQARLGSQCEETFLPALVALDSLVPVNSGKDLCVCACTCVQHVRVCMCPYMCV